MKKGIATGKGRRSFKGKSAMYLSDPAEVREVEQMYGKGGDNSILIHEDDRVGRFVNNEHGEVHNYFFGSTRKYAEGYDRIFGKTKKGR